MPETRWSFSLLGPQPKTPRITTHVTTPSLTDIRIGVSSRSPIHQATIPHHPLLDLPNSVDGFRFANVAAGDSAVGGHAEVLLDEANRAITKAGVHATGVHAAKGHVVVGGD